ncbi:MAG: type II toxin-antitoxin system RelE/ParE family toxin [Symploca sp. SIO3C6]|uniref:Type II toxin-antitoxin system RelE/ParE family toxin n=1 Tax=Symploca sp. SIO1C4 TaxID=2607765 RepID=A0A6B3NLP4_9CYAN|nr:type II toxin-antitoxin system RelE/ParE family toxin [Symploca sp. SIO3C6]NER31855.1 type II toxin-antitoxin system RelE/ParE family toxin [Symploca sp. SIO1C4]
MNDYRIYLTPEVFKKIKGLPGNIRQRLRKAIQSLKENPCPGQSKRLDLPEIEVEFWRLRLDKWRILYAINESERIVDILAVCKRPPYDYGDLEKLLEQLE